MTTARIWFGTAAVVYVVLLAVGWATLPDRVPIHFGLSGSADSFADRSTAVLVMAAAGFGLAALFLALAAWMPRMPLTWVNVPHKEQWTAAPERERRPRGMLADDMHLYGALTMTLMCGLLGLVLTVADDPEPQFGVAGWVLVGAFALTTLWYAWHGHRKRYRPNAQ